MIFIINLSIIIENITITLFTFNLKYVILSIKKIGDNMLKIDKINTDEALRYMGYNKNIDIENIKPILAFCEKELLNSANIRYCYKLFDIEHYTDFVNISGTNLKLTGNSITNHLEGCNKAVLMACTLSDKVDKLISRYNITDMTSSLITDSMASALIEQVCDKVEIIIKDELKIENMTWRFSPGYGDLPIDIQKNFIQVINAEKQIGLTVTETNILIPRKSVTAVIGISDKPIPQKKRGCLICNMNKTCQFRKRGSHCGF